MKKALIVLAVLAVIAAIGYIFSAVMPPAAVLGGEAANLRTYDNPAYGISFTYPQGYVLSEGEKGNGERGHYQIMLIRQEDAKIPENGEGPTAITFDLYQNTLDRQTLFGWLTGSNQSNFKLGPGTYASTTVGGKEAVTYRWSGLYEGETAAFLHNGNIVAVSVTWLTPEDANVGVYRGILKSLRLSETK